MPMDKELFEAWQMFDGQTYTYNSNLSKEFLDEENYGWEPLGREARTSQEMFSYSEFEEIRSMSRFLYKFNDHYRGLVRTYIKYCFGKNYTLESEDEQNNEAWKAFQKKVYWRKFVKEIGRRFFRDGEVFIYVPEWKFINPSLVQSPDNKDPFIYFGIEEDRNNPLKAAAYWVEQGKDFQRIDAQDMIYICEKDQDDWRGLPYFISVLTTCRNYKKWLQDRIILNRIRASIGLEKIIKGASPTQVSTFAASQKTTSLTDKTTNYGMTFGRQVLEPGKIMTHNDSVEYKYLTPNLQASDVAEDGRKMVLSIAAAVGLPEYMVSGDSSNANYSSTLVAEGAAVKEFDSWMEFFTESFIEIWHAVMRQAGLEDQPGMEDPSVILPSIIARDQLKETQRNEILFQNGVIDVAEWQRREGIDPTKIKQKVDFADLQ